MRSVLPLSSITEKHRQLTGGKGYALAHLFQNGFQVPPAVCISATAYRYFISQNTLEERILMELHRKKLEDMRWEEMWDVSLRIRNLILRANIPEDLYHELYKNLKKLVASEPVVIRSSSLSEDSAKVSFAGLHESYVNVVGVEEIITHIKLVWASLWSDGALLYKKELGLDFENSAMPVVVQKFVAGQVSGVVFSENPLDPSQAVIEAVHGLNQGLVSGAVEPDRWILDRNDGRILEHVQADRKQSLQPDHSGVRISELKTKIKHQKPLDESQVKHIFQLVRKAENLFSSPQDMEWTFRDGELYVLQSRPVTTRSQKLPKDDRSWYLSLRPTFANLENLRKKIEGKLIPEMIEEAETLSKKPIKDHSDRELSEEIANRKKTYEHWVDIYWNEFIPFAHGMRLFGQIYNKKIHPADPYEFIDLLRPETMQSLERNQLLKEMGELIRKNQKIASQLKNRQLDAVKDKRFNLLLDRFKEEYGSLTLFHQSGKEFSRDISRFLLQWSRQDKSHRRVNQNHTKEDLTERFLSSFKAHEQTFARELLDLARASYRLRDDDNIYLGRIEKQLNKAVFEGRKRISKRGKIDGSLLDADQVIKALRNTAFIPDKKPHVTKASSSYGFTPRQLLGQPASPGVATGKARVIIKEGDLLNFKKGEILVCDAIDPNMTFVVPLAKGIVERRGGMLIHGAIIAREYAIPCVTGVPDVANLVETGDTLTVDGFLGIVVVERKNKSEKLALLNR